mmetsp:Transcript_25074/g.50154  ORF Transcript_25074/g.50154 Transcript_25074/m.50154 type:complete len:911 (+) Transcript_25074:125-2857(+)
MGDARVILQSATMNFNPFRSTSSVVSSNSPQSPRSQPLPLQFSASRSTQIVRACHGNYDLEDTTRVASNSDTSTSTGSVTAAVATNATTASPSRSTGPMAPLSVPLAWLSGWGTTSFSSSSAEKQNHSHHHFSTNSYASQNHGGGDPLNITDNHQKLASSSQTAALTPTTIGTTNSPRSALPPPPIMHSIDSSHPNPNPSAASPNSNNAAFTSPPPKASMITTNNVINRAPIPTSLTMLRGTESNESDDEESRLQNLLNNSFDDDRGTTMPSITSMMSAVILGPEKTMKKQQQQRQDNFARVGISLGERVDMGGGDIGDNIQTSTYSQQHQHHNHQLRQPQQQTDRHRQMHPQQHSLAVATSNDKLKSIAPDSGNIQGHTEIQDTFNENYPKPIGSSSKNAVATADAASSVAPNHPRHHQQQQTNHKQHHHPKESNTTFPGFALFEMAKVQYCLGKYSKALDTTTECLAFQKLALERMENNSSGTGKIGSDTFSAISNGFAGGGSAHGANSGISGVHASASAYVSANGSASGGMPHPDNRYCSTITANPNHHPSNNISSLGGTNAKVTTTIGRDISHDGFGSSVRNLGMGVVRSLKGSGSGSFYGSAGSSSIAAGNSANGTAGSVGGTGNSANVGTVVGGARGTSSLPMVSRAPLPSVTINKNESDIRINHPLPHSIMANTTTMMISHYPTHSCIAQTLLLRGRVLAECGLYGCHDEDEDSSGSNSGGNGGSGGTDFLLLLQAIRHVEMAVAIQRRITIESNADEDLNRWKLTTPLVFLGIMRAQLANFEEADMAYEEALSILRSVKEREKENLSAAKRRGDDELVKECESCIRQINSEIAHVLCLLGRSHHCRRSYEKAFDCYNRGLRLHKRLGSTKKNGSVRGIRRCMKDRGALEKLVSGYWDDRSTI